MYLQHLQDTDTVRIYFLAVEIRISEVLVWDRNSYLTHVTQALTCGLVIGYIGVNMHGRQVTPLLCQSDVIM